MTMTSSCAHSITTSLVQTLHLVGDIETEAQSGLGAKANLNETIDIFECRSKDVPLKCSQPG